MEVIALRSSANCGKSHTLNVAYQLLLNAGYKQVPGHFGQEEIFNVLGEKVYGSNDFFDVLINGGKIVGIATGGEYVKDLAKILIYFKNAGCVKAICACTNEEDTLSIIKKYTPHIFIDKTAQHIDSLKRIDDGAFARKIVEMV
ncbi:MAG: hypothetical protein ACLQQ4_13540 [Bacteroidia bacterium]